MAKVQKRNGGQFWLCFLSFFIRKQLKKKNIGQKFGDFAENA